MMKNITLLAAACLCSISAFSTRYLVQTGAEADAKWTRELQVGEVLIDLTTQGKKLNEVYKQGENEWWLAAGDYEITASMNFVNGVKIYGGFAGTETSLAERAQADNAQPWEFENITSITGNNTFPIFTCTAALPIETILDGVTVQNGVQTSGNGGGMTIRPNGYVRNCRFLYNTASGQGGAILFNGGGTVENSYFFNNNAKLGGACHIAKISSITGCLFENNIAEQGGAIRSQATDGTIANCIIRNNTATTNGSGIYTQTATTSATKIINCLIYGNRTKVAIYMYGADIINCTVDGGNVNSVYVTTAGGKIINSVFTSDIQSDLATGVEFTNNAYAAIKGNDGWTNSNNLEITDGNFGFTDAANGDYTLASTSPLIDAGIDVSESYTLAATDLFGTTRPQGTAYDLGAYECPYYTINVTIEGSEYGAIYDDQNHQIPSGTSTNLRKGSTLSGYITINEGCKVAEAYYTNAAGTKKDLKDQVSIDAGTGNLIYAWTITEDMDIKVVFQEKGTSTNLQEDNINPFRCTVNNGMLQVSGIQIGETIIIYNIAGSKVAERTVSESTMSIALQQGIYIVRAAGQTKKIILN